MANITKELIKEYYDAYYCATLQDHYKQLNDFKLSHPQESAILCSMHNKRSKIRKDIECLQFVASKHKKKVYFGALTFNDEHIYDKCKRKKVQQHLNDCFIAYFIVEELGALHGRYHVHFVGVFKDNVNMSDFHSWLTAKGQGYSEIKPVVSVKKTAQYLCDYLVKQVPRIHRNKAMCEMAKRYCKAESQKYNFPSIYNEIRSDLLLYSDMLLSLPGV